MRTYSDPDIKLLAVIGVVAVVLLLEIVVATQAYFYNTQEAEIVAKQVNQPSWELNDLLLEQQAELNSYRWVDRDKRRVSIPVDLAIQRFVEQQVRQAATRPR